MDKKFAEYGMLNLADVAREVLEKWDRQDVFARSVTEREGCPSFVFYEGPPSANGMPGIHHVMARSIKDTFCRYKTMKGYQVARKAGWDTHGLPVELGVEKLLGITKEDIGKTISVDDYNRHCREEVMKYTKEWTDLTHKMGYWVAIWYAANVVDATTGVEAASKVLYVELLSPTGVVLKQQKLKVVDGRCHGSFSLIDTSVEEAVTLRGAIGYPSGYYQIRAYTRAMLNFDDAGVFSRVIPVYKAPRTTTPWR